MRCTIHPATAQDVANVVLGHAAWANDTHEADRERLETLLEACAMSRQVWTASTPQGERLAFIGAAPWAADPDVGRIWFVVLRAPGEDNTSLKSGLRLIVAEMLQVFEILENHVGTEKSWALQLMRDAGFKVDPPLTTLDGVSRHRVWIDAGPHGVRTTH